MFSPSPRSSEDVSLTREWLLSMLSRKIYAVPMYKICAPWHPTLLKALDHLHSYTLKRSQAYQTKIKRSMQIWARDPNRPRLWKGSDSFLVSRLPFFSSFRRPWKDFGLHNAELRPHSSVAKKETSGHYRTLFEQMTQWSFLQKNLCQTSEVLCQGHKTSGSAGAHDWYDWFLASSRYSMCLGTPQ